jgi:hypothetical protein
MTARAVSPSAYLTKLAADSPVAFFLVNEVNFTKQSCPTIPFIRRIIASLIVLGALGCLSCNGLRVYVSNKVPPDFTFNAGRFAECCTDFRLFAVFEEGSDTPLWRIASKTIVYRTEANSMLIHYGKLPDRFEQEIPTSGEPPPLVGGKTYVAVAGGTSYVPWARVRFMVKDNKIVSLPSKPGSLP